MCLHPSKQPSRRRMLIAAAGSTLAASTTFAASGVAGSKSLAPIRQPAEKTTAAFINRAFDMQARAQELGDQAYGAVVVHRNIIIGQSWSRVVLDHDPTGHAEMSALRDAGRRTGGKNFAGAILYSSSPPCSMCQAAAAWVGIAGMIHGRNATIGGPPRSC